MQYNDLHVSLSIHTQFTVKPIPIESYVCQIISGNYFGKGKLCFVQIKVIFCNEQCMFFIKWCFLMEWALSFDLIFLQIMFIFGNLFLLPAKINTKRTDWENTQVLKFNSADAGKGFLNSVTSTMERTIFLCLSPMLWWYRKPSKSLTQSSEVLLFWRNKEGLGL